MKIWFRVGMEADITPEEMDVLLIYSGQKYGEREPRKAHYIMKKIIERAELSGETYILGKDNGGALDDYDNPDEEIDFLY
jgi:hypothetical protein